eukprot:TRINITY_DN25438_c0_g1_i1.p1 TRINITY_DN25438_c0_g1~~TRINITY_DN25438_c0_g1_i1.p1  ORF type:complete len:1112 (+),score=190.88 TRINITY_DN25438_c0_g1_i1:70-3336(+)
MSGGANVTQAPAAPDCKFSWGSFPEFLAIQCEFDWEAALFIALFCSLMVTIVGLLMMRFATSRFNTTEDSRIRTLLKHRVAKKRCTFGATLTRNVDQEWWRCRTCYGISEMGCCSVCAASCHKGHDLEKSSSAHHMERKYCSCGASGRCRKNEDFDTELKSEIKTFYLESDTDGKLKKITDTRFHWHYGVDGAYFSAIFTGDKEGDEDFRVFEFEYHRDRVVAMGGPGSGQQEDTAEQAIAAEWDKVYNLIDIDGDGVLSAKEIERYFRFNQDFQNKLSVNDLESFEKLLKKLDENGDGVIDRTEFALLIQELGLVNSTPTSIEVAVNCAKDLIAADAIGTSDPYVVLEASGVVPTTEKLRTAALRKNLNPVWNERFKFDLTADAAISLRFIVYDDDRLGEHDFLGFATVSLTPQEIAKLVSKSKEMQLKLGARPSNSSDLAFFRRNKGKLGTLMITLRASATMEEHITAGGKGKKKYEQTGRTMCVECRRKLFFIPKVTETKSWVDTFGTERRLRRLPMCPCGVLLVPDGWRDQLRSTFEQFRGANHTSIDIEPLYPIREHITWYRLLSFWIKICACGLNAVSIVIAWGKRPHRDPSVNLNLSILCMLWTELFLLMSVGVHMLWSVYKTGLIATGAMLPDEVLGAHLFRTIPIGWFPQEWMHAFRKYSNQRSSLQQMRHSMARTGLAVSGLGCVLFFVPLPFYCMLAKLAFLRHVFGGNTAQEWAVTFTIADVIIAANVTNNVRNVIDIVRDRPPAELRMPSRLWNAVIRRTRGPVGEGILTTFALLTFAPRETSLPLLYEIFVLNNDGVLIRSQAGNDAREPDQESEQAELEVPLLEKSMAMSESSPPGDLTITGGQGWLGEATEKLQSEVERLEMESIEARREVKLLQDQVRQLEAVALTSSTPLQLAVRRVLLDFPNNISLAVRKQLETVLSQTEARSKDLCETVKKVVDNPLLNDDVRSILAEALGGRFTQKPTVQDFTVPSPPVIFPPERVKTAFSHREPAVLTEEASQPPTHYPVSDKHPQGHWAIHRQKTNNVLSPPEAPGSPASTVVSISDLWSNKKPSRTVKADTFMNLAHASTVQDV